ncbi:MAG TPA: acetyl-CoA carboxylase carboxyltransferase subunit alpha [Planctomycetota bacterium]|nr:acetyl-CoA carboxylase carboxyltransferase subunit alpha [Planctomycetota bacterium]
MSDSKFDSKDSRSPNRVHIILEFEKPIIELEKKIGELEALSKSTGMDLDGEVRPLKERLGKLVLEVFRNLSPLQVVQVARHPNRPLTADYLEAVFDDFVEVHGDRGFRDDRAIAAGFARLGDRRVVVIGHRKGRDTREKMACYWGCAHPEGYRKALRLMKLAEKLRLPVVTFIDTPGAYPGIGAEERGQAWAIAESIRDMSGLRTPVVCTVVGEGGSGGALGIGVGDHVMMLEHAYYSVISPEGCAAILWNDAKRAGDAAKALKLTSRDLLPLRIIDEVIPEPVGGAHRAPGETFARVRERLTHHLDRLAARPVDALLEDRYAKFRRIGSVFVEPPARPSREGAEPAAEAV